MNPLPTTSKEHYITGRSALNVPNPDGTFADWHFANVFLSGKGKIRIAGKEIASTSAVLGDYGIRECSDVLRAYGAYIPENEPVFSANHIRAILDLALSSAQQGRAPEHVTVHDMLDSNEDIQELAEKTQQVLGTVSDSVTHSLIYTWAQKHSLLLS